MRWTWIGLPGLPSFETGAMTRYLRGPACDGETTCRIIGPTAFTIAAPAG